MNTFGYQVHTEKICENCGKVYTVSATATIALSRFCSRSCKSAFYGRKNASGGLIDATCPQCGKVFQLYRSHAKRRKYCSKACMDAARMKRRQFVCPTCGKEFERRNSRVRYDNSFCSHRCFLIFHATSIERMVQAGLDKRGVAYVTEHAVSPFSIDIFIPSANLAVECDGTYWHSNRKSKDAARDRYIAQCGITVVRFPESEINDHLESVLDKIQCLIRE